MLAVTSAKWPWNIVSLCWPHPARQARLGRAGNVWPPIAPRPSECISGARSCSIFAPCKANLVHFCLHQSILAGAKNSEFNHQNNSYPTRPRRGDRSAPISRPRRDPAHGAWCSAGKGNRRKNCGVLAPSQNLYESHGKMCRDRCGDCGSVQRRKSNSTGPQ